MVAVVKDRGQTVSHNVTVLVLGNLEERRPFRVVLEVKVEVVCLRQGIQVAFGELVEVIRAKPTKVGHIDENWLEVVQKVAPRLLLRGDYQMWFQGGVLSRSWSVSLGHRPATSQ